MNLSQARLEWERDRPRFEQLGAYAPGVVAYLPEEFKRDYTLAMDAMSSLGMDASPPGLMTSPNSGIPSLLTTMIDPAVYKILFAPNKAAQIMSEVRKGTWLDETAMFPTVEYTGEVSTYGDFSESGHSGANTNWPQRQSYLFQTIKEYGERELERAGLARINWVSEIDQAAALGLNKFSNYTYFFGVQALQNYGLLNDPNLNGTLTPSIKAAGGSRWISAAGAMNATANEVYSDIQACFYQLQVQTQGLVEADDKMCLAMHPALSVALTNTNQYNVNVYDLLRKNFPNIRFETAVQYGATSAQNPQGISAGNMIMLKAEEIEGQDVGYCSFNEKQRAHPIVRSMSSFRQKVTAGTWGTVLRMPAGIVTMTGL